MSKTNFASIFFLTLDINIKFGENLGGTFENKSQKIEKSIE